MRAGEVDRRPRELGALLLAAGYGTRLGALGERTPKGLLPVPGEGRAVMSRLLEELVAVPGLAEIAVVTNRRFRDAVASWVEQARAAELAVPIRLLCDGTEAPEERLGAVGDLAFALDTLRWPVRDLLVLATDTVCDFRLVELVEASASRPTADVVVPVLGERPERLSRRGVAVLNEEGRVVRFVEKSDDPPTSDTVPPLHLLRARALPLVGRYLEEGGDPDAPGHLLEWLVPRVRVEGWRAPGGRLDLGAPEGTEPPEGQGPAR